MDFQIRGWNVDPAPAANSPAQPRHPSRTHAHIAEGKNSCIFRCSGGHDRGGESQFASLLRSDTLLQHQSDPRHRPSLIPTRGRNDDINWVNLAARTTLGRSDHKQRTAGCDLASVGLTRGSWCVILKNPACWADAQDEISFTCSRDHTTRVGEVLFCGSVNVL